MSPQEIIDLLIKYNSKNIVFSDNLDKILSNKINSDIVIIGYYLSNTIEDDEFAIVYENSSMSPSYKLKDLEKYLKLQIFS